MSQVRILSPRPLILIEFFWVVCLRFQIQRARGSRNGSSFRAVKSREISAALGCQRTKRGSRAFLPSTHHQKDRFDSGGTHESSDGRDHRGRRRQKRTAGDGTRGDVLHDVEARIRRRQRRTLASPPHVLLLADRPRILVGSTLDEGSQNIRGQARCCILVPVVAQRAIPPD
jgi:hypothetical protein